MKEEKDMDNPEKNLAETEDNPENTDKRVLLKVKHVDVKFNVRGRVLSAIRDANLEIYDHETLAIVGESGSGKSVLTKTFAGMLDSNGFISHGNIYFYDDEISKTSVPLNKRNSLAHAYFLKKLNAYSYEEVGFDEFLKIEALKKRILQDSTLSQEESDSFETRLKEVNDDLNDTVNFRATLSRHEKGDEIKYKQASEKIKALQAKKKAVLAEKKAMIKARHDSYHKDEKKKAEDKAALAALNSSRNQKIADKKKQGLTPEVIARNEDIASEILLAVGRYPLYLLLKYAIQLLKGFHLSMDRAKDLMTEKQRRRVFEPIVFRCETRGITTEEGNKLKKVIDSYYAPAIKMDVVDLPDLHNDTLLEQARSLHKFIRKNLVKKLHNAYVMNGYEEKQSAANSEALADLILLKAASFDSEIHALRYCSKVERYFEKVLASKKTNFDSGLKSRPLKTLNGYAFIDCAKVRYAKDWQLIRGRRIATVFQDPMTSLNPILTIGKQIMMVIQKHQHVGPAEAKRRALIMMEKVGIPDPLTRFDDYPFQYSGGMRQRIVIAIALSCQPKILICDEPTTALDVTIQAQIIRLIKKLSKDLDFTTVYITHDLGVVANVADRVAVLYGGQIVELGTVEDIFYDPRHPYTWALLSSMPQLAERGTELFSIGGTPPSLYNKIVGDAFAPRSQYAMAIDFVKEPPVFEINDHHWAKTWLLDPRAPKVEKPAAIQNLHEKMLKTHLDIDDD
jgi:oligopeptide/dipeptide ABC transporter ATP-binding protein